MAFLAVGLLAVPASYAVGLVLPMTGPRQPRGEMLLHSIQMKADGINDAGGIDGHPIELVVRDSRNVAEFSRAAATELSANPRVLAVIGHYDNEAAAAAVPGYDRNQVPGFLPSLGNKDSFANSTWAFSGTYDDASEAQTMAVFIKLIRHHDDVLVFHTSDLYEDLWSAFQHKAGIIGLKARDMVFASQTTGAVPPDFVAKHVRSLPAGAQGIVVLGRSANGGALIRQLRERGIKVPIYGNSRVSQGELFEVIGPHTQDLHAAFPFMFDIGSEKALEFRREYLRRYKSEPGAFGIFAYDGLGMIAEGIRAKGPTRVAIRDYLASFNSPSKAYEGASGILYFDVDGAMVRDTIMATAGKSRFPPGDLQLRVVTEGSARGFVDEKVKLGEVIVVNGIPFSVINVVYTGIEYYRVNQVNVKDLSFEAEFFLWFKWSGEVDVDNIQFLNEVPGKGYRVEMRRTTVPAEWHGGQDVHWVAYRFKGTLLHAFH